MLCSARAQEKGARKFACILAFDVPVNREARELAESMGVRIFSADIIYHLFDQFTAYLKQACTPSMLAVGQGLGIVVLSAGKPQRPATFTMLVAHRHSAVVSR